MQRYSAEWFRYHFKNNKVSSWLASNKSLYLMAMTADMRHPPSMGLPFKINDWEDIESFENTESWHNRDVFLKNARTQLDHGANCITLVQSGQLAFIDWVKPDSSLSTFGDVQQSVVFPSNTSTQYSAYVHPTHRRKGLFYEGMNFLAEYIFSQTDTQLAIAAVEGNNTAALKGHLVAGFEVIARLETNCFLGRNHFRGVGFRPQYAMRRDNKDSSTWYLEASHK